MEKGRPYSLRPEDAKRRLADDLARICEEAGVKPVVIGGLAVNHHGYMRVTADVDILVARRRPSPSTGGSGPSQAGSATPKGSRTPSWASGSTSTSKAKGPRPARPRRSPNPAEIATIDLDPLPVPTLPELLALKVMSGRARDDADVVELLRRHRSRMASLRNAASRRLRTEDARKRLRALVARAKAEAHAAVSGAPTTPRSGLALGEEAQSPSAERTRARGDRETRPPSRGSGSSLAWQWPGGWRRGFEWARRETGVAPAPRLRRRVRTRPSGPRCARVLLAFPRPRFPAADPVSPRGPAHGRIRLP